MADLYDEVLDRLYRATGYAPRPSSGWTPARCPAHEDRNPSASVLAGNYRPVLKCHQGCDEPTLWAALGLPFERLGVSRPGSAVTPRPRRRGQDRPPVEGTVERDRLTVERLAAAIGLPPDELRSYGLENRRGGLGVVIPYRDAAGALVRDRYRLRLTGDRFRWDRRRDRPLIPYGLWRLPEDPAEPVLVTEGESDPWVAWHVGVPALGIPGSSAWNVAAAEALRGRPVVVVKEPGDDGDKFVAGAVEQLGAVRVLDAAELLGADDVRAAWDATGRDVDTFQALVTDAMEAATPAVRNFSRRGDYRTSSEVVTPLPRALRENLRKPATCPDPVGRIDRVTGPEGTRTRGLVVPCERRTCPECRRRLDLEDAARIYATFAGRPLWLGYVPEADWPQAQRRIDYRGEYAQLPAPGDRRAVLSTSPDVSGVEWQPVTDLAATLDELTRTRPMDRRHAGGTRGVVVTRDQLRERLRRTPPKASNEVVEPLGFFSTRSLYADRAEYRQADPEDRVERLRRLAADELEPEAVRAVPGGFDTSRPLSDPRTVRLLRLVGFQPLPHADLHGIGPIWDPVAAVVEALDGEEVAA